MLIEDFCTPKIVNYEKCYLCLIFRDEEDIDSKSDLIYVYFQNEHRAIPYHILMFQREFPKAKIHKPLKETPVTFQVNNPENYYYLRNCLININTKRVFFHNKDIEDAVEEVVDNYWEHWRERKEQGKKALPQNVFIQKYQQLYHSTIKFTDRFIFCLRKELKYI